MNMPGFQNPRSERDGVRDRLADARGSTWRTSAHSELLAWVWWLATIAWVCISEGGGRHPGSSSDERRHRFFRAACIDKVFEIPGGRGKGQLSCSFLSILVFSTKRKKALGPSLSLSGVPRSFFFFRFVDHVPTSPKQPGGHIARTLKIAAAQEARSCVPWPHF